MRHGCRAIGLALAGILVLAAAAAGQQVIMPLVDSQGRDSGWNAIFNGADTDIAVDLVMTGDFVVLELSKDFYGSPVGAVFPPILIGFQQRLADQDAVSRIIIADESITNLTGTPWTDFHWALLGEGVWFDVAASGNFGVQPLPQFQNILWGPEQEGSMSLTAYNGLVAAGSSYLPGTVVTGQGDSDLVIVVDLEDEQLRSFILSEQPTPEPASMVLLGLGLGALVVKRRRAR